MGGVLVPLLRALLLWAVFILAESVQGALRRWWLGPQMEIAMRLVPVAAGVGLIFAITWFGWRFLRLRDARAMLATGALWAALTLTFEIALGRILGVAWDALDADYDPSRGGMMAVGLLAMALTPWAVGRLKRRPD